MSLITSGRLWTAVTILCATTLSRCLQGVHSWDQPDSSGTDLWLSFKDCLQANCLFSRNHIHAAGELEPGTLTWSALTRIVTACACKSATCIRLMAVPVRNPIRISSGICAGCALNNREDLKRPLPTATPGPMRV
jgi:hypothetical protein